MAGNFTVKLCTIICYSDLHLVASNNIILLYNTEFFIPY